MVEGKGITPLEFSVYALIWGWVVFLEPGPRIVLRLILPIANSTEPVNIILKTYLFIDKEDIDNTHESALASSVGVVANINTKSQALVIHAYKVSRETRRQDSRATF